MSKVWPSTAGLTMGGFQTALCRVGEVALARHLMSQPCVVKVVFREQQACPGTPHLVAICCMYMRPICMHWSCMHVAAGGAASSQTRVLRQTQKRLMSVYEGPSCTCCPRALNAHACVCACACVPWGRKQGEGAARIVQSGSQPTLPGQPRSLGRGCSTPQDRLSRARLRTALVWDAHLPGMRCALLRASGKYAGCPSQSRGPYGSAGTCAWSVQHQAGSAFLHIYSGAPHEAA